MFISEGIKAVRMDDIARTAGVSKRTLYEVFGDKDGLIFLAVKRHFEKIEIENKTIGEASPNLIVAILDVTRNMIRQSGTNWKIINTLRKFHPSILKRLQADGADVRYKQIKEGLNYGIEEGTIDPRINVDLAINMMYMIGANVIFDNDNIPIPLPTEITPQHALFEMTTYLLRGIATPRGGEIIDKYWSENR